MLHAAPVAAFTISFNEYGNCTGCAGATTGADPTGSGLASVLIYTLPNNVGGGDVAIAGFEGGISDGLRFTNNLMIFYSFDCGGAPADICSGGVPVWFNASFVGATERADETFTYIAGDNTYNASSASAVPEPATLALLGAGLVGLVTARRRRAA